LLNPFYFWQTGVLYQEDLKDAYQTNIKQLYRQTGFYNAKINIDETYPK